MSDPLKWICLKTGIFDDSKIRLIEALPDADALLVIFVKLLCLAGKCNADGMIYISPQIPLNEEHLATLFVRPVTTIRLALVTFQALHMIEVVEGRGYQIVNWERHQNVRGIALTKQLKSESNARYNERTKQKKLLSAPSENQSAPPDPFAGCSPELVEKWRPAFDAFTSTGKLPALMIEHLVLVDRDHRNARLMENYGEIVAEAKGVIGTVGATLPWLRKVVSGLERRIAARNADGAANSTEDKF